MVALKLAIAYATTFWRLIGTLLTLVTERALILAILKTVPLEGSGGDYDIYNRVVGSSTTVSSFLMYFAKLFSRRKEADPAFKATIIRTILIAGPIFAPILLSLLFDGGLTEFGACSSSPRTVQLNGAIEQSQSEGLCRDSLTGCSGFRSVNYTFYGCDAFSNVSYVNGFNDTVWFIGCEHGYNFTFSPSELSEQDNQTLSTTHGSLEIMPLNYYYDLSSFKSKDGNIREYSMSLGSPRRISEGTSKQGLAWFRVADQPGTTDVVTGVPITSNAWQSGEVEKTIYRTETGCVYTGVAAADQGLRPTLVVTKDFDDQLLLFAGDPEFFEPLRATANRYRNSTLSNGNWSLNQFDEWMSNSSSFTSYSSDRTNKLVFNYPLSANIDPTVMDVLRDCNRFSGSASSPLLFDDYRTCYFVTIVRKAFNSIVPPLPSFYPRAYQFICAARLSVGIQKGKLSRGSNANIRWDSVTAVPSYLSYRVSTQYAVIEGYYFQYVPLFDMNLTDSAPPITSLPPGAVLSTQKNFHPIYQSDYSSNTFSTVQYQPPSASFLYQIIPRSFFYLGSDGNGLVDDSEMPNEFEKVTLALADLISGSVASSFVTSLGISPFRDTSVALNVTLVDDKNLWTCIDRPVLTGIIAFTVLPLFGAYIAILIGAQPMLRNGWRKMRAISGLSAYVSFTKGDPIYPPEAINSASESYHEWVESAEALMLQFVQKTTQPEVVDISWFKKPIPPQMHLVVTPTHV
ncbi:hypothetical protein BJ742DRAFT_67871 [Cladochytrium replicatum]|nr:hypothetical protein BJ742DRAFT_67871 [Cladochytrium replicatum]